MKPGFRRLLCGCLLLVLVAPARAQGIYQTPEAFLDEVFGGAPPAPRKMWIKAELADSVRAVLGHDLGVLRLSYWGQSGRTVWILEEIGKEQPITAGIVVNNGAIESVRVLVFRESRGWEVRHPFFTDQFKGARLVDGDRLDRGIDGISGATLSVGALTRLARLALLLHAYSTGALPG
ncbi:MAG: FMN-binding protein [Gammaproteobacteria bacterium]|nr:FMN-binding protein [Gammaproteobacteria bacterium]